METVSNDQLSRATGLGSTCVFSKMELQSSSLGFGLAPIMRQGGSIGQA